MMIDGSYLSVDKATIKLASRSLNLNLGNFNKLLIGFGASFYLATYIIAPGAIAALPILLAAFWSLFSEAFRARTQKWKLTDKYQQGWLLALFAFGAWSIFTVWLDNAALTFYEVPAKFVLGAVLAYAIFRKGIDIFWIKLGALIGVLLLGELVFTEYSGNERFSPLMNATKWGNAVAFQMLLTLVLIPLSSSFREKLLFAAMALAGLYFTIITGTRGALLPFLGSLVFALFYYRKKITLKTGLATVVSIVTVVVIAYQQPIVQSRINSTIQDFKLIQSDNYNSSIGIRLTMWSAGIQSSLKSPIIGNGYTFEENFKEYKGPTLGLDKNASIAKQYRFFHSAYIDTIVTKGIVGLILLITIFIMGLTSQGQKNTLIMVPAIIGIAFSGLTDSALNLGITTDYLVLAGTIFKAATFTNSKT